MIGASGDGPRALPAAANPGERDQTLSMAVLLYLGVGVSSFPTRLPSSLVQYFGPEHAAGLRERVDQLLKKTWVDPEDWGTRDLAEASRRVATMMELADPELSPDAVQALAWNFSYQSR